MTASAPPRASLSFASVRAYTIPTDAPEADGTLEWDKTTMVLVEINAGGERGIGFSYASEAAVDVIRGVLARQIEGRDAMDVPGAWNAMVRAVRNIGRPGIAAMAISAIDIALWDLKAKLLREPLSKLLGMARPAIPAYGSGGFTSYNDIQLMSQLGGWAERGFRFVKMKVGTDPDDDLRRVRVAKRAIGGKTQLFVDANGSYSENQAADFASRFGQEDVRWFEEPVSSDDLAGLRFVRDRAPACMDVAAGEYGFDPWYFEAMLNAKAVDVLQVDVTRCLGITGFLRAAALADGSQTPISAHCAPSLHVALMCAVPRAAHIEWFHDHDRIEHMLFDGAPEPRDGMVSPDLSRPGLGLEFRRADAEQLAR